MADMILPQTKGLPFKEYQTHTEPFGGSTVPAPNSRESTCVTCDASTAKEERVLARIILDVPRLCSEEGTQHSTTSQEAGGFQQHLQLHSLSIYTSKQMRPGQACGREAGLT